MQPILNFENKEQFQTFLKEKQIWSHFLGAGSEASCYQSPIDSCVYKIRHELDYSVWDMEEEWEISFPLRINQIITSQDISVDSFFFPTLLFTHNDQLLGYKSNYAPENLFSRKAVKQMELLETVKFEQVLKAYYEFLPDVEKISREKIKMMDLPFNLVFDGTNFSAIDTWWYQRQEENTLKMNLEELKLAIISVFEAWTEQYRDLTFFQNTTIEEYLKDIEKEQKQIKRLSHKLYF